MPTRPSIALITLVIATRSCSSALKLPLQRRCASTIASASVLRGGSVDGVARSQVSPATDAETISVAIDRAVATSSDEEVILQFEPRAWWLWSQFHGTVLAYTWKSVLTNMFVSFAAAFMIRFVGLGDIPAGSWPLFTPPDKNHPVVARLLCLNVMWTQMASLSTFILTFFVSQAYTYWRSMLGLVRSLQGRLHDISFLAASYAARDESGSYTPAARKMLDETAHNVRLLNVLFWSGIDDSLAPLRTTEGLQALSRRGVMSERELQTLMGSGARYSKRHEVVLQWLLVRIASAARGEGGNGEAAGRAIMGGDGLEASLCDACKQLRAACGTVPDQKVERMPLAYMHIVHVMIDLLMVLAPLALYPKVGALTIPLCGVLTLFYRGLLELAKSFLDPFGNEGSSAQNILSDVLIAEVNRGSGGWWRAGEHMPFTL